MLMWSKLEAISYYLITNVLALKTSTQVLGLHLFVSLAHHTHFVDSSPNLDRYICGCIVIIILEHHCMLV